MTDLIVSETFVSFQGEGPSTGTPAWFARLGRCNLSCRWCDAAYTWDWRGLTGQKFDPAVELTRRVVGLLVEEAVAADVPLAVLTGGEPLLQMAGLTELATGAAVSMAVEVETNGTRMPTPELAEVVTFNVSPKLAHSGDAEQDRIKPGVLRGLAACRSIFKFVASSARDLVAIERLVSVIGVSDDRVYVMGLGVRPASLDALEASVRPAVEERGWKWSDRRHIRVYGDTRGT